MADVSVKLEWTGGKSFGATNGTGRRIVLDGEKAAGPSPMDLVLEALGGCSAIDIVVIMEKVKTPLTRFEMTIEGTRAATDPRYFTEAVMRFDVWGEGIDAEKLNRAISLSIFKYCSVFHSLRQDLRLRPEFRIHAAGAEAAGEYQAVRLAAPQEQAG